MKKLAWLFLAFVLIFTLPAHADVVKPLHVVTSFSILADMTKQIGGDAAVVTSLVPPNADPHTYQPTPQDVRTLVSADIIVINGLGFEGWMERLIQAAGVSKKVVVASDGLKNRLILSLKGTPDPHAWQNLSNGRQYVNNIGAALQEALPQRAKYIYQRELAYSYRLSQMDQIIRADFATVPVSKKKIITDHDAFAYFGAAYGIDFMSPVGLSTEAEPSAANVARLINQIKMQGIKRIFLENMTNPKLIKQIAEDADIDVGGTLYSDSLSPPDGPAPTYVEMFQHNVSLLKAAMIRN